MELTLVMTFLGSLTWMTIIRTVNWKSPKLTSDTARFDEHSSDVGQ